MSTTPDLLELVDCALAEDLNSGDLTSEALFSPAARAKASIIARQRLVVSGLEAAALVFSRLDDRCRFKEVSREGAMVRRGKVLASVSGPTRTLLSGERTALNFLRHLSGIATLTREYVEALSGTGCTLLDTRKTTPGLRVLEKAAVRAGGGSNHRCGLFDGVMIKDNHISAAGSIRSAVKAARRRAPPTVRIEVECANLAQVKKALAAGADIIMLDNMPPARIEKALDVIDGRAMTEASGNLTLENIRRVAETGVDFVSVGALTHSAPAADIAMEFDQP